VESAAVPKSSAALALVLAGLAACVTDPPLGDVEPPPTAGMTADLARRPPQEEERAEPTERHRSLAPLLGDWTVRVLAEVPPGPGDDAARETGKERVVSIGTARLEWALGGHFVSWVTRMRIGEQEHGARGMLGYDPKNREYQMFWASDLTGSMSLARGVGRAEELGIVFRDVGRDVLAGHPSRDRVVLRLADDGFVVEYWGVDAQGAEILQGRTVYERAQPVPATGE
jgi:hypothetical protein